MKEEKEDTDGNPAKKIKMENFKLDKVLFLIPQLEKKIFEEILNYSSFGV